MPKLDYRDETAEGFVIEFFMPKRLDYVSQTYAFLREELRRTIRGRAMPPKIYGFSFYEVDGAFIGEPGIMEDRTMVVRVFFKECFDAGGISGSSCAAHSYSKTHGATAQKSQSSDEPVSANF